MKKLFIIGILVAFLMIAMPSMAEETLTVSAIDNGMTPVSSSALDADTCYQVDASGTFVFGGGLFGDAEWQQRYAPTDVPWTHEQEYWNNIAPTTPELDWLDLLINDASVDWAAKDGAIHTYSETHEYTRYIMGTGNPITFRIADSSNGGTIANIGSYTDNSGSLAVTISEVSPYSEKLTVPLYAGSDSMCQEAIGFVEIYTDGENIYVRYHTDNGWFLSETHFEIGDAFPDDFHVNKGGNPQVGLFRFGDDGLNTQDISYVISKEESGLSALCGAPFYVATHAAVINPGDIIAPAGYNPVVVSNVLGLKGDGAAVLLVKQDPANGLVTDYEAEPRILSELLRYGNGRQRYCLL